MKFLIAIVLMCGLSSYCLAQDSNWYVALKGGLGSQGVTNEEYIVDYDDYYSNEDLDTTLEALLSFGYQFSNGVLLEAGLKNSGELFLVHDVEDGYSRHEIQTFIGYTFMNERRFTVTPKVGLAIWELKYVDDRRGSKTFDDQDVIFGVDLGIKTGAASNIVIGYNYADYDFGYARSIIVGVRWDL